MELEFREYDGSTVVLNPRVERSGDKNIMKFNEKNCDYFLLFSTTSENSMNLRDDMIQDAVRSKGNLLPDVRDMVLMEDVAFSCIEWSDYKVNDCALDLPDRAAEYMVIGCREENGRLAVYIPDDDMNCMARVSLTVSYRISQIAGESSRRLFAKKVPQKSYFVVEFDDIPDYRDGGIIYRLDGLDWDYPITRKMLENGKFYIEAGYGTPRFMTVAAGLELRQL